MASEIDICNLALSHVGGRPIESFTEGTKEAIECGRFYAFDRDAVLEDHNWNFARKRLDLALTSDEVSGWTYSYAWPTDCLAPRRIYNPKGDRSNSNAGQDANGRRTQLVGLIDATFHIVDGFGAHGRIKSAGVQFLTEDSGLSRIAHLQV